MTSCDLDTFKDTLTDDYGFYFDPLFNNGQCRSIAPQHVQTIKDMNKDDASVWTFHLTGITSIPLGSNF